MRAVKIASVIFTITIAAVLLNSFFLSKIIDEYKERIEGIDSEDTCAAYDDFSKVYEDFKKKETYISLTVTHTDLTEIEELFSSAIGAARAKDSDELEIIKSRLVDALQHLGRLVGINFDSIL